MQHPLWCSSFFFVILIRLLFPENGHQNDRLICRWCTENPFTFGWHCNKSTCVWWFSVTEKSKSDGYTFTKSMCVNYLSIVSSSHRGSAGCTGHWFEAHLWPGRDYGSPVTSRDDGFSHPSESREKTAHEQHILVGLPDRDGIRAPHSDHVHPYFQNEDLFKTRANVTGTLKHVKSSVARSSGIVLRWSSGYGGCSSFSPPTEAFCDLLLKP